MSENNKWSIKKKFERGEVMINTTRFCGYDKNEYGDLVVNWKEAEIVRLLFDLYLMNIGCSRLSDLLNYLGVKTMTDSQWETGTIGGMLSNEKYKGDFHLQKYYTPSTQRNVTRRNHGEVQSYYISENHEPIVSPELWGTGSGNERVPEKGKKHWTGRHKEISEPLSIKRKAHLSILRKNTPQAAGLQQEDSMAVQHIH